MPDARRQVQVRLAEHVYRTARLEAAARGISVNRLLSDLLGEALIAEVKRMKRKPAKEAVRNHD